MHCGLRACVAPTQPDPAPPRPHPLPAHFRFQPLLGFPLCGRRKPRGQPDTRCLPRQELVPLGHRSLLCVWNRVQINVLEITISHFLSSILKIWSFTIWGGFLLRIACCRNTPSAHRTRPVGVLPLIGPLSAAATQLPTAPCSAHLSLFLSDSPAQVTLGRGSGDPVGAPWWLPAPTPASSLATVVASVTGRPGPGREEARSPPPPARSSAPHPLHLWYLILKSVYCKEAGCKIDAIFHCTVI